MEQAGDEQAINVRAILEERAKRLSVRTSEMESGPAVELLHFSIGEEKYAIETRFVRRVAYISAVTPLPEVPLHFAGVTNIEGDIVPLVSLSIFLGGAGDAIHALHAVLLGIDRVEFGILVDRVDRVDLVPDDERVKHSRNGNESIRCVLRDARVVVDGEVLLKDPRLSINRAVTTHDPSQEKHL